GRPGRFSEIRSMLAYGGNLTGFSVVNYFARNLDDVLIGRFHGAGPLGLYQKAYEILMVPIKQINNPVSAVAIPALSRLVDQPERYRKAYLRILEKVLLLTMPLAALLIATADWVVLLALGPQWTESAQIFAVLGILVFIQPLGNSTGWLFITQDRTREMLRWGVLGSTLSIISFLVGLPWGVIGVAAAYAISGLVVRTPILLWYVGRRGPVRTVDFYKRCAPFALSGVVTLGVLLQMRALEVVTHPAAGLAIALALTLVTMPTVLAIFPGGRDAMRDAMAIATRLAARRGSR
ncbi:MAG: oligosaccharide flippase family protein, partial [Bradymonadaceae bacterium]